MTTQSENELLTQIGPGTPMGALLRQYWVPACLSSELIADGDPVRLALLGEKLVAFRDSSGRIGILDHRCPHRCASLFFGRNEEGRAALRLSRLEVRYRGHLPRYAEPASRTGFPR
jgi:phthalate 4,5-dioxygenase